jgi:hypothetical protein
MNGVSGACRQLHGLINVMPQAWPNLAIAQMVKLFIAGASQYNARVRPSGLSSVPE